MVMAKTYARIHTTDHAGTRRVRWCEVVKASDTFLTVRPLNKSGEDQSTYDPTTSTYTDRLEVIDRTTITKYESARMNNKYAELEVGE